MVSTENNFQTLGKNLILISNKLLSNQNLCKLLYYSTKNPLSETDIAEPDFLMNKNIRVVPKVPDITLDKGSIIVVLLENYDVDSINEQTLAVTIRFDIICPIDEWIINEESLRPMLIMSEISSMFNKFQLRGIGKMRLVGAERIAVSDSYAGYTMIFTTHDFN